MKRIIFIIFIFFIFFHGFIYGQGFYSFSVKGELQPALIKNKANDISIVEVIVREDVDLKNLDFEYKLLSDCYLESDLSKDFSEGQQSVIIGKKGGKRKEWIIYVKQLKSSTLPIHLSFSKINPCSWTPSTLGWVAIGTDHDKKNVVRFGNENSFFYVAFNEQPHFVCFELEPVAKNFTFFDGVFIVETSRNGKNWSLLAEYNSKTGLREDKHYEYELTDETRYIRWIYQKRNKLNLNLNNIKVW